MKNTQIKLRGTFNEFVNTIKDLGFRIVSETEGDNMCTIITEGGGIFNWWKSTSTLGFQGKEFEDNRMKFISKFGTDYQVSGPENREKGKKETKGVRDTLYKFNGSFEELRSTIQEAGLEVVDTYVDDDFHAIKTDLNVKFEWTKSDGQIRYFGKHANIRLIRDKIQGAIEGRALAAMLGFLIGHRS